MFLLAACENALSLARGNASMSSESSDGHIISHLTLLLDVEVRVSQSQATAPPAPPSAVMAARVVVDALAPLDGLVSAQAAERLIKKVGLKQRSAVRYQRYEQSHIPSLSFSSRLRSSLPVPPSLLLSSHDLSVLQSP